MNLTTPPLNALRVFDAIARMRNITKAAEFLHITQSAASQQVKLLEDYLSASLIERNGSKIRLTPLGEQYAERIVRAFDDIRYATQSLKTTCLRDKKIAINSPTTFAMRWLFKRLPSFQQKFPEYDLTISTPFREVDFEHEEFEAAIYLGNGQWPGLTAIELLNDHLVAVCSPKLLASIKKQGPISLDKFTLISAENMAHGYNWKNWIQHFEPTKKNVQYHYLRLMYVEQTLEAALNGNGVAMAFESLVKEDLEQKRLVKPFKQHFSIPSSFYFVYPTYRENDKKIIAMREWLLEEIRNPL